jgi:hypothetical protein
MGMNSFLFRRLSWLGMPSSAGCQYFHNFKKFGKTSSTAIAGWSSIPILAYKQVFPVHKCCSLAVFIAGYALWWVIHCIQSEIIIWKP